MASTGQATSSPSNFQLIIDALAHYARLTGIDLSKSPFAERLELSDSTQAILDLLEERESAFEEYRHRNRRLISCINPVVKVLHAFSGILGEAISLAPFPPAKAVFVGIDALLAAASGVTSSYDALMDLFENLGNFLKRLEIYTAIPPTPMMTNIIVKIMVELLSVLALATKQIKQGRLKKFTKRLLGESEVDAVLMRLDRLTQEEARMTVAQTFGVVHGLVGNVRIVMEDGKASTDSIRRDLVALREMLNEMNKMKRVQLQRDVQHWLCPPDPSTNHDFVWSAHHEGTASWFLESDVFKKWKTTGSLLWIHGKPGAGKSTFLSAIIQDIQDMHVAGLATMAYYYFDFRDVKKQDRYGLLFSLLSQLSSESDPCYEILSQLYVDNAGGTRKPTRSALLKCLKDMLSLPGQGQIFLIVDALDECPNFSGTPSAREEVLELVDELVGLELPNVHLCVTSRPEIDIRTVLEPLTSLNVSLHDEVGQKEDILEYIRSVVRSDKRMRKWKEEDKQLLIDTLSDKADGMFRWVVCQVDTLRRNFPASIRSALNDLPKTLDDTYGRTLLGIDEEKREFAQRLFRCLMVSIRPLRVEELAEILAFRFHEEAPPTFNAAWRPADAEEAVMSACSSLIAIVYREGRKVVQFSHFSVKEFLTSERLARAEERLSCYYTLPEPAHTVLAHASLGVLLQLDDEIDRDTISHFPLALYAARHWVDHAQFRNVSAQIQYAMERLFDEAKPHFAAWVWLYNVDRHWEEPMSEIHPTQPEAFPLYYASLCGLRSLVEHLIVAYSPDVNGRGGSYVTSLHVASVKGHSEVVSLLLKNGADPDSRGDKGRVPLHRVSQSGPLVKVQSSIEVARFLINFGANVNVTDDEGWAPLHAAASNGCRDIAQLLLGSGASLDVRNKLQQTPLYLACESGKLEVSRFLVDCGADLNSRDNGGLALLHAASQNGHVEVVRLLLDRGADVNVHETDGVTPLHYASRLGYLDLARLLLNKGADLSVHKEDGWTPLHFASRHGHLDIARLLIDNGADLNIHERYGWTPLHFASRTGNLDLVRIMIENGVDVNAHKADRWNSLHLALGGGHLNTARLLIQHGANVNSRNGKGETPLELASAFGYLEIARLLIERGAETSSQDDNGWNPFHMASNNGHLQVAKFLLDCGIDVDIRTGNEGTALGFASGSGRLDVVRFLIENGADINVRDSKGWNPLHIASRNGYLDVIRLLLDSGTPVDIRNGAQNTPLALASWAGKVEVGHFLIERGADTYAQNDKKWAPIHFASLCGHLDMVQLLLDHGVDADVQQDDLWNPLHLASANGHLKVAELLVQRGARVDAFNDRHKTPLDQAAGSGKVEMTRLLIDNGADLHTTDINGWTPLHSASHSGHLPVVKLLLPWGADADARDKVDKTAAELASENGKAEVARFIAEYKADIDVQHNTRSTTLDTAQYGADEGGTGKEDISLHTASQEGKVGTVELLLSQGADINARNAEYRTPLEYAVAWGHLNVVRLLIERGAEVDPRTKMGWTPLHLASRFGHVEIVQVLVDHGANVNARNQGNWTPIHHSASNGHIEITKLLLERGADLQALTDEGQTPYERSLQRGYPKIADLLREHGASP